MILFPAAALLAARHLISLPFFTSLSLAVGFALVPDPPQFLTPADIDALPSKPADARIAYGDDQRQFAELRLPPSAAKIATPFPVAIVLHGGCWVSKFATLRNTAALADALRDAGIATWNVEYRAADSPGGGWPGTFLDVARAADHLRAIAAPYQLDLARAAAIGHSAGGHLALWLAARHRLAPSSPLHVPDPLPLRGVVSLAGIPDLAAFREHGKTPCEGDVVAQLMGGGPAEVPERYREGSPIELLPLGVPQFLVAGAEDATVPPRFAESHVAAARRAGDDAHLLLIPRCAHHEYNAPAATPWPHILSALATLLGVSLAPGPTATQ
jgi:acetyl esterase/lipase